MELSLDQKREFHDSGFLVLPGAVSGELVGHARRAINHSMTMGEVGMSRDDLPAMRSQTYCREIRETAAVTDLPRADGGCHRSATRRQRLSPICHAPTAAISL